MLVGGYSTVMARKDGAWTALNGVKMDGIKTLTAEVAYSDKHEIDNDEEGTATASDSTVASSSSEDLNAADLSNSRVSSTEDQAASTDSSATNLPVIEVRLDSPDGDKIAEFTLDADSMSDIENTYTVDAVEDYEVHERGFTEIKTELTTEVSGTHDIYLVFQKPGTEIYTIQGKLN